MCFCLLKYFEHMYVFEYLQFFVYVTALNYKHEIHASTGLNYIRKYLEAP